MRVLFVSMTVAGWFVLALPSVHSGAMAQPSFLIGARELRATVETVDPQSRMVLLRGTSGTLVTVHAGPEVRNLPQLKPGDQVTVRYAEAVAAEIVRPGDPPPVSTTSVIGADPGQRPEGLVVDRTRERVRIEGIDTASNTVAFVGPDRVPRTVAVRQPGLQEFIHTLKPGDEVDVTFTEAVAISVEPAAR